MSKKTQKCSGNIKPRNKRSREWSITAWIEPVYDEKQMSYLLYGKEICPNTQKLHYQTYVYFYNAKTFEQVTSYFFKKGENRVELSKGSSEENIAYCTKDDDYKEFGTKPSQGKRTDLDTVKDEILAGKKVDDILLENPTFYHQYGRTLNAIEDVVNRSKHRLAMTQGTWYYGETGTGKSHQAFKDYDPLTHYYLEDDNGWWDDYRGQDTVIINDFRGEIPYNKMLKLVDQWPMKVKRRGRPPIPFVSKHVIITSSLHPSDVYHNREDEDKIEQLLRRFEIIKCKKNTCFK